MWELNKKVNHKHQIISHKITMEFILWGVRKNPHGDRLQKQKGILYAN